MAQTYQAPAGFTEQDTIRLGKLNREALVHLAGGDLTLRYEPDGGHILLTGEAVEVFSGEYPIAISHKGL